MVDNIIHQVNYYLLDKHIVICLVDSDTHSLNNCMYSRARDAFQSGLVNSIVK